MNFLSVAILLLAVINAVTSSPSSAESQIKAVLSAQVEAWNHGDIPTFVSSYAADCTFVGKEVAHGRTQLLARYRKNYPTTEAMGHLTFNALDVRPLTADVAIVTGAWHLERPANAGSDLGGLFSLVLHREGNDWKIVLDHTS